MPRPTNKIDLLNASETNFKKLLLLVKSMSEAHQEAKLTSRIEINASEMCSHTFTSGTCF